MSTLLQDLRCGRCDRSHLPDQLWNTCADCGGPLLAAYSLEQGKVSLAEVLSRRPGQVRCHELYPTRSGIETPSLGEGATPLVPGAQLGADLGLPGLLVKDESQNPTLSFKARGMAAAMARAKELGVGTVCLPSAGNAGGAAAAYGALHGIRVVVAIPESTPEAIGIECDALGADVTRIPGTIADAGRWIADNKEEDWFSLATLKEPYRVEGKKVMGYELLYDLGRLPDVVVYPTGGGTGLIGMWKAFDEMEALGWIDGHRPRMVCVQGAGCAPMVRAFEQGLETAPPWEQAAPTAAFGLRVPGALGDFLILRALRESGGTAVAIDEGPMLADTHAMATRLGLQASPEGGACIAAARQLKTAGWIREDETVVVFNTGHAFKYGEPAG
ncbi:MAG: threonine synthase [Planctomycetota bacterium]|nr:threonine synthase [Planctomycetota bacterium]MEE2711949.1 threonine synthase [Planctomycetota bacterium]